MKRHAPATSRNREPLRNVLTQWLPDCGRVLEVASGTGEHAVFFARSFPFLEWQPSDSDSDALASIAAHRKEASCANLAPPIHFDVTEPEFTVGPVDAIVCINMVHIAPFSACEGLFRHAQRLLKAGAPLVLYGPFRFHGEFHAPSNAEFDRMLKERNPLWGVRDLDEIETVARQREFRLGDIVSLPANNHCLIFLREPGQ